jgi:hypothetical protein
MVFEGHQVSVQGEQQQDIYHLVGMRGRHSLFRSGRIAAATEHTDFVNVVCGRLFVWRQAFTCWFRLPVNCRERAMLEVRRLSLPVKGSEILKKDAPDPAESAFISRTKPWRLLMNCGPSIRAWSGIE